MILTILENVRVVFLIFKLNRRNSSRFVRYNSLSSVHDFSFFWYFEYNGWHSRFPLDILNTVDGILKRVFSWIFWIQYTTFELFHWYSKCNWWYWRCLLDILKQHMATKLLVFFILSSKDFMLYTSSLNTESGTRIVSSSGILYSVDDAGVILFLIFWLRFMTFKLLFWYSE